MSRVSFGTDTTPSLGDLDANFVEVYDVRDYIRTPAYTPAGSYVFTFDASMRALMGNTSSIATRVAATSVSAQFQVAGTALGNSAHAGFTFAAAATTAPYLLFGKSRNTSIGSHTVVQSGDTLGRISAAGSDGTQFTEAARISFDCDGTPGTDDMPGRIVFSTTADGASSPTEALRISQDNSTLAAGSIKSSSATAGVGYATGAGGSVTQATSKSTGVTVNAICGQITMNGASLAASTSVSFTVTNSAMASHDEPRVWIKSGGSASSYFVQPGSSTSGSFTVHVRNVSGGSLSEALVLGFAISKVVIA